MEAGNSKQWSKDKLHTGKRIHAATKKPSIDEGGRCTTTLQEHLKKGGLSTFQTDSYSLIKDLK
jgi:hypothetical protein